MLLETMTAQELSKEILTDWDKAFKSTDRLGSNYDKQRRRLKIDKESTYSQAYEIKTNKKNNWIFILSKAPAVNRYKGQESINICSLVYYYSSIGLRVFKIRPQGGGISVYNGHLFNRYNERMNLGLTHPIDIVKSFFMGNGYSTSRIILKENKEFAISICRDGLLLGELQEGRTWLVHKTFLTRDLTRATQDKVEEELINNLKRDIEAEINKPDFNKPLFEYQADILKGIQGTNILLP